MTVVPDEKDGSFWGFFDVHFFSFAGVGGGELPLFHFAMTSDVLN